MMATPDLDAAIARLTLSRLVEAGDYTRAARVVRGVADDLAAAPVPDDRRPMMAPPTPHAAAFELAIDLASLEAIIALRATADDLLEALVAQLAAHAVGLAECTGHPIDVLRLVIHARLDAAIARLAAVTP